MSKTKILLSLVLVVLLVSSCCFCFATEEDVALLSAEEETATETPVLDATSQDTQTTTPSEPQITEKDLYEVGEKVVIDGIIDGNAYVMGKEVTVTGEIGGDLFIMAEKVNIDGGYIYSNLFILAEEVNFNGIVYDLYAACNTLNIQENGIIYRDIRAIGNDINFKGRVRRNAFLGANNLTFAENSGTLIYGNLEYSSTKADFNAPEGVVKGEVKYTQDKIETKNVTVGEIIWQFILSLLQTILFTFVVVIALLWLAPNFIEKLSTMSVGKSFACLGIGFLAPIVLVVVGILLLITTIGAPVLFAGLWGYMFLCTLASAITSIFLTKLLSKKVKIEGKVKFVLFTLLIAAALWLVNQIPFIDGLVSFLIFGFGTGAILVNILPKKADKTEESK